MSTNEIFREAWIRKKLSQIPEGESILDAGAGELKWKPACSHLVYTSQDFCQYTGAENSSAGLQHENWDTSGVDIVSDIISIPVEDGAFENVLCSEVLEHVPDPIKAVAELSRVLKIGGKLILTAPFCSLTHFAPYHFSTGFNIYWYRESLTALGFEIIEEMPNGNYFSFFSQELSRLTSIIVKYGDETDNIEEVNYHARKLIECLQKYDRQYNESYELLCFGWNILARKR